MMKRLRLEPCQETMVVVAVPMLQLKLKLKKIRLCVLPPLFLATPSVVKEATTTTRAGVEGAMNRRLKRTAMNAHHRQHYRHLKPK
jgi:hypothetical protein